MSFSDILGQQYALERVGNFLKTGRLPHGIAFSGPRGTGKKLLALGLVKAHYCTGANGDFCDRCPNCARIDHGNHPDVHLLELTDKDPHYRIETLRERLLKRVYTASVEGILKFFIVDKAHRIPPAGQNAILKTLEEPPEGTHILLLVEELSALLPTVRSRLQVVHMRPLPPAALATIARRNWPDADETDVALAVRFARGSAARVGEILADGGAFLEAKCLVVKALAAATEANALRCAEAIIGAVGAAGFAADVGQRHQRRAKAARVLDIVLVALRDAAMLEAGADESAIINADQLDALKKLGARVGLEGLLGNARFVQEARKQLAFNVNVDMMLKRMILELAAPRREAVLQE